MIEKFKKTAINAAIEAGKILRKNYGRVKTVDFKGRIDLVTDVDRKSEKKIVSLIKKVFPNHDILAEEAQRDLRGSPFKWIIDPLDGTTNYAHSYPFYCVSIALEKEGEVILGAIYNPSMDELFYAEKGTGSFLNRKRIRVSAIADIDRALLVTGFPYDIRENPGIVFKLFENFALNAQGIRRGGSAALDLCYVACGRLDGFWETRLKPWDTAAGSLIAREAGAAVTNFRGKRHSCYEEEILASNGLIHEKMLKIIAPFLSPRSPSPTQSSL